MKVIGVIALILAILLGIAVGAVGVLRWCDANPQWIINTINDLFGWDASPLLEFIEPICDYLPYAWLLNLIVASAALFIIAIFSFIIVNIKKKRAIAKAIKKANAIKQVENARIKRALPFVAAGVLMTVAVVGAAVVLKKQKTD